MQERDVVSLFSEVTLEVLLELGWKFVGFDQVEYVTSALEHEFMKQMKDVSSYPRPSSQYTPLTVPKNEHNKHMQIGKGNGSSHMNVQNAYRYHFCSMWSAHQRTEKVRDEGAKEGWSDGRLEQSDSSKPPTTITK